MTDIEPAHLTADSYLPYRGWR